MTPPTAAELDAYRAQPIPAELDAYRARTDRLYKLVDLVARMAPCCGESTASGFDRGELLDDLSGPGVTDARDTALVVAFAAIERIAKQS